MKENIAVVGNDYDFVKAFAEKIASLLKYKFVDTKDIFDKYLLHSLDLPTIACEDMLKSQEILILQKLAKQNKIVASISVDMFVADENYKYLDSFIIYVDNTNKRLAVRDLIVNRADLVLNQELIQTNDVLKLLRGEK